MKRFIVILFLATLWAGNLFAISVDELKEIVVINNSGNATIDVDIFIKDFNDSILYFPVRFANSSEIEVLPKEKFEFSLTELSGISMIRIRNKGNLNDSANISISFSARDLFKFPDYTLLDFRNRQFVNKFQNITFDEVKYFSSNVVLPEGYEISKINNYAPYNGMPYEIIKNSIRSNLELKANNIKIGESAFVDFNFRAASKSKITVAIVVASLLIYIWVFRFRKRMRRK